MSLIYLLKPGKLFPGIVLFITCCLPFSSWAQCAGVTLQGAATESRCEASGSLTITVTGAQAGSTIVYGIVNAPALFPTAQLGHYQSSNLFEALPAGNYDVNVQISDGINSCVSSISLVVPGNYVQLDMTFTINDNTQCSGLPGDGKITVQALHGRQLAGGGYSYSLISPTVYAAINTNGVFDNLPDGTYTIRAYDSCGNFQSRNITVGSAIKNYSPLIMTTERITCNYVEAVINLRNASNVYATPAEYTGYTYGYYDDAGVFVGYLPLADFISASKNGFNIARDTFSVFVKDLCGNVNQIGPRAVNIFNYNGYTGSFLDAITTAASCTGFDVNLINYLRSKGTNPKFTITCAPDPSMIGQTSNTGVLTNLPFGTYCYRITDDCGRQSAIFTFTKNYNGLSLSGASFRQNSCTNEYGNLTLDGVYAVSAPLKVEVIDSILNVSGTILRSAVYNTITNRMIVADSLPVGKNIFVRFSDKCGTGVTLGPFVFAPFIMNTWNNISPLCVNKADLKFGATPSDVSLVSTLGVGVASTVKKTDGTDYGWFQYFFHSFFTLDSFKLNNLPVGDYLIKTYNGVACENTYYLDTVTVLPYIQPTLADATGFTCNGSIANNYTVTVASTGGLQNLMYEITGSTPNNIVRAPQSSTAFTSLPYNENIQLRMVDGCGNSSSNAVIIKDFLPRTINMMGSACAGGNVVLRVQPLPGDADYTWRFNGTIISSGLNDTTFSIPAFSNINYGDYTVDVLPALGCQAVQSLLTVTNTCSALPVDFISFTGTVKNNYANLEWKTTHETGVDHFEIEKSTDGIHFLRTGTQTAGNEHGVEYTYRFNDQQAMSQKTWYRIAVVNLNGSKEYSTTIVLAPGSAYVNTANVAPNPFHDQLAVNLNSKSACAATVSIYDAQGRMVLTEDWKINIGTNQKIVSPKAMLTNGMYYIRITTSNNEVIFKSSVLKQ